MPVTLVQDGRATGDDAGRAIGRPVVARALVAAGHVASIAEAFERYLTPGQPAFVPRDRRAGARGRRDDRARRRHRVAGASRADEARRRHRALGRRPVCRRSRSGTATTTTRRSARYAAIAERYGLLTTGGSDFHGDDTGRVYRVGEVGTPPEAFARLDRPRLGQPVGERR